MSLRQENPAAFKRGFAGSEERLYDKTDAKSCRFHILPFSRSPICHLLCAHRESGQLSLSWHATGHAPKYTGVFPIKFGPRLYLLIVRGLA